MRGNMDGVVDTKRLIFPGLGTLYQSIAPYSYAVIRFCAGAIVIYHGYMKLFGGFAGPVAQNVLTPLGFPAPLAWAYFLGVLEFFGGAALAVGFLDAAARAHVHRPDGDRDLLARGERIFLLEPARRLGVPAAADDYLRASSSAAAGAAAIDRMIGKEF